jgi:hypothetical protein
MISAVVSCSPSSNASEPIAPPTSIDATGATDVTMQLKGFIAGVPDGSTISFPAGARYRIDGSLIIEGRNNLTFEGNGAEFFATTEADRNRRHWWIRNSDGITIRDVVVRGANPNAGTGEAAYRSDREAQHGFDFAGVKNVIVEKVTVTDVYGDFVYIGRDKSGWSKQVTVRDSHFERNGRQGIAITAGEDIKIERNKITQVRRSTFDIEPNTSDWGARRVTISDNDIGPGRLSFLAGHGAAGPVEDIMVVDNRLSGKVMNISFKAPSAQRRANFSLIGNVSNKAFGSPNAAVTIEGFDGVTIRDNVLPLDAGRNMTAVQLKASCDVVVTGNQFTNAAQEVKTDGYDCAKASPAAPTTLPTVAQPSTPDRTATPKSTTPLGAEAAVPEPTDEESPDPAPTSSRAVVVGEEQRAEQEARDEQALATPHERLSDASSSRRRGFDPAILALGIGAVISLAVLIPASRRRR